MLEALDTVKLNFNQESLFLLNICIGFIMFGVALELRISDFKRIATHPKPIVAGLFSQFFVLPFFTYLLVIAIKPTTSVGLGLILVAACPGGNISNFISLLAKANIALSVTLTGFSTLVSIILTPLNFTLWGTLYLHSNTNLQGITIDILAMFQTVMLLLGIPLIMGMWIAHKYPDFTKKITRPVRVISLLMFAGFVVAALSANYSHFLNYIHLVIVIVFFHNIIAYLGGFLTGKLFKLHFDDVKSITIETGIQNSGIALIIVFDFFKGQGGMAYIAAWWGIWHILSGLGIAYLLSKTTSTPVKY